MKYISTRGNAPVLNFEEVLLTGLASDGGLYVPETLPQFSEEKIRSLADLPYDKLAYEIISPFVGDCIPSDDLQRILTKTYQAFHHPAVAPLVQLDNNAYVLELFHGPTLAFKDYALQLLGALLDYVLEKRQQNVVIMGATSGDTGSAAIEGCRRCKHIDIFILHPHNRVSEVQRRQMTTVKADNVFNIALEGNFDDCQKLVKASFRDQSFLPDGRQLVAVNSINWCRIMAQIVYYFYAALNIGAPQRKVAFSVPTGNFGNIFAGYLAKGMGLPIEQLVIATNTNDILHRFVSDNRYEMRELLHTLAPSMDIMVSSNFERLLFDVFDRDGAAIDQLIHRMSEESLSIDDARLQRIRALFDSHSANDKQLCEEIASTYAKTEYLLDPHTAIGVVAAEATRRRQDIPMITLGTAHPVKFPDAVVSAGLKAPELPLAMADLFEREEYYEVLANDISVVQQYVTQHSR